METVPLLEPGTSYEDYDCRVNAISTEELFARYRRAGFLYPAKLERLSPHWAEVSRNWRCAVMLAGQEIRIRDGLDASFRNWYRTVNRLPARVFGTAASELGSDLAAVATCTLMACTPWPAPPDPDIQVEEPHAPGEIAALRSLAAETRSAAYVRAEELDVDDLQLDGVDSLYRLVGLRRFRRIWLAWMPGDAHPLDAAIVFRGPMGLNFSVLENRCDLLIASRVPEDRVASITRALLARAGEAYEDYTLGIFPVVTDARTAALAASQDLRVLRRYCQSVWLRNGYPGWYRQLERFYTRLHQASHRRGFGAASIRKMKDSSTNTSAIHISAQATVQSVDTAARSISRICRARQGAMDSHHRCSRWFRPNMRGSSSARANDKTPVEVEVPHRYRARARHDCARPSCPRPHDLLRHVVSVEAQPMHRVALPYHPALQERSQSPTNTTQHRHALQSIG